MKKVLFYAMREEKMCFLHILMNALDLKKKGHEVKVIFEGASVNLAHVLENEENPLYEEAKEKDLIAGICLGCSKHLGVYEKNQACGLPFLDDMMGHAGMASYVEDGYQVISL